jgi:hypothetical protein
MDPWSSEPQIKRRFPRRSTFSSIACRCLRERGRRRGDRGAAVCWHTAFRR